MKKYKMDFCSSLPTLESLFPQEIKGREFTSQMSYKTVSHGKFEILSDDFQLPELGENWKKYIDKSKGFVETDEETKNYIRSVYFKTLVSEDEKEEKQFVEMLTVFAHLSTDEQFVREITEHLKLRKETLMLRKEKVQLEIEYNEQKNRLFKILKSQIEHFHNKELGFMLESKIEFDTLSLAKIAIEFKNYQALEILLQFGLKKEILLSLISSPLEIFVNAFDVKCKKLASLVFYYVNDVEKAAVMNDVTKLNKLRNETKSFDLALENLTIYGKVQDIETLGKTKHLTLNGVEKCLSIVSKDRHLFKEKFAALSNIKKSLVKNSKL